MDFRSLWKGLGLAAAVAVGATPATAALPEKPLDPSGVFGTATLDNVRRIDVNSINMWVTNYGSFGWDLTTGNPGMIFPKGTDKTAIFASGVWLGASVGGGIRTVVAEFSQEYGPGAMVGGSFDNPALPEYRVLKVIRWTGDPSDSAHVNRPADALAADPLLDPLDHHSWSEYLKWGKPHGAPTRIYRLPDPNSPGDSVDVEGPDVLGDQMMWSVYNDADPSRHTNDAGGSTPLGVEIQQTTFAFDRPGPLGNTLFLKYTFINKGANQLDSMFVSLWCDPDLGGFTDDLVGVDTSLSLGYVYNASNNDQIYGATPPAVGYDFFRGPTNALGDTLGLVSFNKYINGTDPASTGETYNYMNGLMPDGSPVIDNEGQVTNFFHAGDPITGLGWLDSNPADRRFLMTAGPFAMAPGDTQEVVGGVVVGQGNDRLSSISALRFNDTSAQRAFDLDFDLPSPPPAPKTNVSIEHEKVTISWDAASRLNYNEPGYTFEGYNVYQGASVAGPWRLIATYDEINSVRVIFDEVFDVETGQVIPEFPVAFGSDAGVRFSHTITQDAVRGGRLKDGTEYFFAVTAYAYGPGESPKVLENSQSAIRVIPQRPPAGTDLSTASATPVMYTQIDPNKPPTTDQIVVEVVNPKLITGDNYRVAFTDVNPPFFGIVGNDTATVKSAWNLINTTTGDTLLKSQLNRRGDEDYRVVEGLRVREIGSYFPQFVPLGSSSYLNNNTTNRRALTGVNWGGPAFFGGVGTGWDFFGGTLDPAAVPDSFTTVELRFGASNTGKAYRYLRYELDTDGSPPAAFPSRGYRYGDNVDGLGFVDIPVQAWDVINNVQFDIAFVERFISDDAGDSTGITQAPTYDATWAPDESGLGGREYLFVVRRPYSDTPKAVMQSDGVLVDDSQPLLYAMWVHKRAASDVIDDGDGFQFVWANPATPNDVFDFDTSQLMQDDASLAASRMDRVRVVPNPYFNRSRYELNQFNRVIRFINLPETCTIRIFNLAGDRIRTLEKTDPNTSILNWDVETDNGLPVGSGVYIYHVDAPGVGTTFGKLAVFMETERLNNF